jgi:hypothetical protein
VQIRSVVLSIEQRLCCKLSCLSTVQSATGVNGRPCLILNTPRVTVYVCGDNDCVGFVVGWISQYDWYDVIQRELLLVNTLKRTSHSDNSSVVLLVTLLFRLYVHMFFS